MHEIHTESLTFDDAEIEEQTLIMLNINQPYMWEPVLLYVQYKNPLCMISDFILWALQNRSD